MRLVLLLLIAAALALADSPAPKQIDAGASIASNPEDPFESEDGSTQSYGGYGGYGMDCSFLGSGCIQCEEWTRGSASSLATVAISSSDAALTVQTEEQALSKPSRRALLHNDSSSGIVTRPASEIPRVASGRGRQRRVHTDGKTGTGTTPGSSSSGSSSSSPNGSGNQAANSKKRSASTWQGSQSSSGSSDAASEAHKGYGDSDKYRSWGSDWGSGQPGKPWTCTVCNADRNYQLLMMADGSHRCGCRQGYGVYVRGSGQSPLTAWQQQFVQNFACKRCPVNQVSFLPGCNLKLEWDGQWIIQLIDDTVTSKHRSASAAAAAAGGADDPAPAAGVSTAAATAAGASTAAAAAAAAAAAQSWFAHLMYEYEASGHTVEPPVFPGQCVECPAGSVQDGYRCVVGSPAPPLPPSQYPYPDPYPNPYPQPHPNPYPIPYPGQYPEPYPGPDPYEQPRYQNPTYDNPGYYDPRYDNPGDEDPEYKNPSPRPHDYNPASPVPPTPVPQASPDPPSPEATQPSNPTYSPAPSSPSPEPPIPDQQPPIPPSPEPPIPDQQPPIPPSPEPPIPDQQPPIPPPPEPPIPDQQPPIPPPPEPPIPDQQPPIPPPPEPPIPDQQPPIPPSPSPSPPAPSAYCCGVDNCQIPVPEPPTEMLASVRAVNIKAFSLYKVKDPPSPNNSLEFSMAGTTPGSVQPSNVCAAYPRISVGSPPWTGIDSAVATVTTIFADLNPDTSCPYTISNVLGIGCTVQQLAPYLLLTAASCVEPTFVQSVEGCENATLVAAQVCYDYNPQTEPSNLAWQCRASQQVPVVGASWHRDRAGGSSGAADIPYDQAILFTQKYRPPPYFQYQYIENINPSSDINTWTSRSFTSGGSTTGDGGCGCLACPNMTCNLSKSGPRTGPLLTDEDSPTSGAVNPGLEACAGGTGNCLTMNGDSCCLGTYSYERSFSDSMACESNCYNFWSSISAARPLSDLWSQVQVQLPLV